jgi:hypothetical protein
MNTRSVSTVSVAVLFALTATASAGPMRGSYASYPRYRYYGAYNQPSYRRYAYHGRQNYRQYGYRQNRQYAYRGGIYTGRSVGYRQTQRGHYR